MRILRGKSNLEVSSHGFALFVVGLILATFVGGAARTLLGSSRVHERIVSELRARFPKQDIKIGASEVLLSRGIWPALGLRISGLYFEQKTCGRLSFRLEVPSAILPVNLMSLFSSRPHLGAIELAHGKLHFDYEPCPVTDAEGPSSKPSSPATAGLPAVPDAERPPQWRPPRFEWKEWGRTLDGARLEDFTVTYEGQPEWKLHLRQAELDFTSEFHGQSSIEVQKSLPFGSLVHVVELEAHSEDSVLKWQVNSEFKEGRVEWRGGWDTNTHAANSTLEVSQFPIKEVFAELYQMGLIDREVQMKSTWVSCGASWEGMVSRLHEAPVRLRSCKLEGAYGGAHLEHANLFPFHGELLRVPIELRVQNLQVQPLVEALNRQVLPTVINRLGVWSGQVRYLNKNAWSVNGYLAGSEIVFSNQSVRGKQTLRSVHTLAEKVQGLVAVKVDQVEMNDGKFVGQVEFSLTEDWRNGTFKAEIDNLAFSPSVQALLMGGVWETLRVRGTGQLLNGELSEWKGVIEAPAMNGEGWTSDKVHLQSKYVPGVFSFESRIERIDLMPNWKYFATVREKLALAAPKFTLSDVRSKVEVRKIGGDILSFSAVDQNTGRMWRGRGNWQRDRELVAVISGVLQGRSKSFALRAEKGLLTVDEYTGATR